MSTANGINVLLRAEEEASLIVSHAKEYRVERLKQARESANAAIESFRQEMAQEFAAQQGTDLSVEQVAKELEQSTGEEIRKITEAGAKSKADMVDLLSKAVTSVRVEVDADYANLLKVTHGNATAEE